MGLRIGEGIRSALAVRQQQDQTTARRDRAAESQQDTLRQREQLRDNSARDRVIQLRQNRNENAPGAVFFDRDTTPPDRAGFGQGSVSVPGSAARTLRSGLEAGRRLLPDPAEVLEEFQERQAEQRERAEAQQESRETRRAELATQQFAARNQAADSARSFVNAVNAAAGTAQSRLRGEEPEPQTPPATITIGSQSFQFDRNAAAGSILNVRV